MQHQELVASLRIAQFVKCLEDIAWDSICGIHAAADDDDACLHDAVGTVKQKQGASVDSSPELSDEQESIVSSESSQESSGDELEDEEVHERTILKHFKVEMRITREAGRVRVERSDPLRERGGAAFSGSDQ